MRITNPNIKSITYITLLLLMFFCCLTVADAAPQVKTDKDVYGTGETIKVNFFNAPGSSRDWICIVAAESKNDDAGDYKYMPNGESQGVLTFNAPQPGKYEVRAYYNYSRNGYVVSARYGFTVEAMVSRAEAVASSTTPAPEIIKPVEKPVEIPAATYSPSSDAPINVAVFHFTPLSMDASHYGIAVTNALINTPKMQSTFIVLNRKDLEIFLSANNLQQSDQVDNMVEIGTRMGMNFVIAGNVIKRGSRIVTSYKVASVARRAVIYTNQFTSSGEAELSNNIAKMSDAIIAAIQRSKY